MSSAQKTIQTTPAGSFSPNGFGLYDMHGNVWEWCSDRHADKYYANSPKIDPQGPEAGTYRDLRGGCWYSSPQDCRSAGRFWVTPDVRNNYLGFRVAVDLPAGQAGSE
jgi:formylglycine-generating enzyme required for sulfatase activity